MMQQWNILMELKSSKHLEKRKALMPNLQSSYGICRFLYFVDETLLHFSCPDDGCDALYLAYSPAFLEHTMWKTKH